MYVRGQPMSPVGVDEVCAAGFAVPAVGVAGFGPVPGEVAGGLVPVVAVGVAVGVVAGGFAP